MLAVLAEESEFGPAHAFNPTLERQRQAGLQ